jgi:hypothetical protein
MRTEIALVVTAAGVLVSCGDESESAALSQ